MEASFAGTTIVWPGESESVITTVIPEDPCIMTLSDAIKLPCYFWTY